MTLDSSAVSYDVYSRWDAREETPEAIADRFGEFIDGLIHISPIFAKWHVGFRKKRRYEDVRDDLAALIRTDISRDDWGKVCAVEGYSLIAVTCQQPESRSFGFSGTAGNSLSGLPNRLSLETSYGIWPDPAIIDYTLFRSLVPTMATCWQPRVCIACPNDLIKHRTQVGPYNEAWILYIPPDLAKTVQTGGVPVVETAPNGGLLLVATTEPFKTDNPVHLAGARKVALAARHLHTGQDAEPVPPPRPYVPPPPMPPLSEWDPEARARFLDLIAQADAEDRDKKARRAARRLAAKRPT